MAKESGLGWTTLTLDDSAGSAKDIRDSVNSLDFSMPRAVIECTGLDKSAMERLLGIGDFQATLNGTFDDAANKSHVVLKTISTSDAQRTLALGVSGQTLSNEGLVTDYSVTRGDDAAFTWTAPFVLADGTAPTWS